MRVVIQRVNWAKVLIDNLIHSQISKGLLIFAAVARTDTPADADYLVEKVTNLRIFPDANGKMNVNVREAGGKLLIVSNFTLYGDTAKGRRPSFDLAAPPDSAKALYDYFVDRAAATGIEVRTGVFQANMQVELQNDGPITLICDSPPPKT